MSSLAPVVPPQLLVSIQNVREAQFALAAGVPWIDLKNPALGSLGRPDLLTARKVAAELAEASSAERCSTSVALGELRTLNMSAAKELMQHFPIVKVGLAGLGASNSALQQQLTELQAQASCSSQIVLAIYADHQRAGAPLPEEIVAIAQRLNSRFVLIDTFIKDGRGLFDWLSIEELRQLREQVEAFDARLVVAGSLQTTDWPLLEKLGSVIVGVRGSVCSSDSDRSSKLSIDRLRHWLQWSHLGADARAQK